MRKLILLWALLLGFALRGQDRINVQIYGHIDYELNRYPNAKDTRNDGLGSFTLG